MNRKLIVTLLQKDIHELNMITEGFMEMHEYPAAIIQLAQYKINDIQAFIKQLSDLKLQESAIENTENENIEIEHVIQNLTIETTNQPLVESEEKVENIETIEIVKEIYTEDSEKENLQQELVVEKTSYESTKIMINDKISGTTLTRNELLSKSENTISYSLANKKIDDIKQAINIGDRFRFQRELFRSNGEDMNKTLNYINQLATFEEAQSFLLSKYGWDSEDKTVEDFYQIVKRRFL